MRRSPRGNIIRPGPFDPYVFTGRFQATFQYQTAAHPNKSVWRVLLFCSHAILPTSAPNEAPKQDVAWHTMHKMSDTHLDLRASVASTLAKTSKIVTADCCQISFLYCCIRRGHSVFARVPQEGGRVQGGSRYVEGYCLILSASS